MKKTVKRFGAIFLALILAVSLCVSTQAKTNNGDVTILFTHDLHSHLLPSSNENGDGEFGGYARLMTAINQQKAKNPNAILLDGGDFSMGSLFQTAFATSAIELKIMGEMGYDVTTFGNHEFDYLPSGLISMLNAAASSGEKVPQIVNANYLPEENDTKMWNAFENYGVKEYTILERGGAYFVVFGIMGFDSDECAPNSGMILHDPIKTAQKTVDTAVEECKKTYKKEPIVVCLSHSGTEDGEGEDYEMAKAVNGIDVIISGHTHTALREPIVVNDTYIVSAGEYGKLLGVVTLSKDGKFKSYEDVEIDENVYEDEKIAKSVEKYKKTVEKDYLNKYGLSFDEVVVNNPYKFDTVDEVYATQHESTLGNLYADSYKWAVENALGKEVDIALTASGVIRETIPLGSVTVSHVFNSASLGVGTEGELVLVYITGKDLKNALEVDASVQPIMSAAQLFFSGVKYSFNTNRMLFNKVDSAVLVNNDGSEEKIEDDKLYSVVAGMYVGQMLGAVKETSFGLLEITPRDKDGNPIASDELVNHVVLDKDGNPLKEWFAISSYLQNMGGSIDEKYSKTDGRKVVYSSINPINLLKKANKFTVIVLVVVNLLIAVIVLVISKTIRKRKKKVLSEKQSEK